MPSKQGRWKKFQEEEEWHQLTLKYKNQEPKVKKISFFRAGFIHKEKRKSIAEYIVESTIGTKFVSYSWSEILIISFKNIFWAPNVLIQIKIMECTSVLNIRLHL